MFKPKKSFSPQAMFSAGKRMFENISNSVMWVGAHHGINSGDFLMMTSEGVNWVSTGVTSAVTSANTVITNASGNTTKALSIDDISRQVYQNIARDMGISKDYMRQREEYSAAQEMRRRQEQSMKRYDRDLDSWRGRYAFSDVEKIKTEVFRQPKGGEIWRRTCMITGETRDELKQERGYY